MWMKIEESKKLTEAIDQANYWGVPLDPDLQGGYERAQAVSTNLTSALADWKQKHTLLQEEAENAINQIVDGLAAAKEPTNKAISDLTQSMMRDELLQRVITTLEQRLEHARKEEVLAAAELANRTLAATRQKQQALWETYQAFREGRTERPVSTRTGRVKIRCESCNRVIAAVDTKALGQPLTAAMFQRLDGGSKGLFESRGSWQEFKCPACGYRPMRECDRLLSELWDYMHIPEVGEPTNQEGAMQ